MHFPYGFRRISTGLTLCALAACQKAPETSVAPLPTPPPEVALPKIVSAEPSSFDAVTRHLDSGGSLYFYLSTESFLKAASAKLAELAPLLMSAAKINGADKAKAEAAWNSVSQLSSASGINEISGFGASSIALEPGYYQTKWMLHHYEGKGSGFLWKLSGSASDALDLISYLPEHTAMAGSGDLTLEPLWTALNQNAEDNADLRDGLQRFTQQFEQASGLKLANLLASIGPNYSLVVTLDDSRKVSLPVGPNGATLAMAEPALALLIQVQDEALLSRVEQELTKVPGIVSADQPDFKLRIIPVPVPLPFIRPAVAWKKGMLIVSSNEGLIRDMFDVKAGRKTGIVASPDFKKLMTNMPTSACQFQFTAPLFQKTVTDLQIFAAQQNAGLDPTVKTMMQYIYGSVKDRWMCSVVQNTPEGFLGSVRGGSGPTPVIAAAAVAPVALVSAIAVPNFLRARKRSQASRVLEDLRMLDAALDQDAIEHNLPSGTVVKFEDLQHYIKSGTALYNSGNKDLLGNPYNGGEPYKVDSVPKVNPATFQALADVAPAEFWSPFK